MVTLPFTEYSDTHTYQGSTSAFCQPVAAVSC